MTLVARHLHAGHGRRAVLHDVSIAVNAGAVTAVIGPNGSGKSTLLRCLAGELTPQHGSVQLDGMALSLWNGRALAKARAVLTQNVDIAFPLRAAEVVMLGRLPHHRGRESDRDHAIVSETMRATGVLHLRERPFQLLSGGEKQRVQLARALAQVDGNRATATRFLLLDEPLAALDPGHQHAMMNLVRQVARNGAGVLVVLHDLALAARYADEVVALHGGRVAGSGTPRQVLDRSLLRDTFGIDARMVRHRRSRIPVLLVSDNRDLPCQREPSAADRARTGGAQA